MQRDGQNPDGLARVAWAFAAPRRDSVSSSLPILPAIRCLTRLALGRTNPKIIGCGLHRYALDGRDLDGIDERFKQRYCSNCPDKVSPSTRTYFERDPMGAT
jgi:hypothetical protein